MSKAHETPMPNLVIETIMLCIKVFLIIFIVTNFVWGVIYFKPTAPRTGNTHVEITQNGNSDMVKQNL